MQLTSETRCDIGFGLCHVISFLNYVRFTVALNYPAGRVSLQRTIEHPLHIIRWRLLAG